MADITPAEKALDWKQIGELVAAGAQLGVDPGTIAKAWLSAKLESAGGIQALTWRTLIETATLAGSGLHKLEEPLLPVIAAFVAPILSGLFGGEFNEADFRARLAKGGGTAGATSVLDGFIRAIVGDTPEEIVPSDAGSRRIATAAVQAALESTFNALVPEIASDFLPFDLGKVKDLTKLPEDIIRTLGVSRLVRRALGPIVDTCCTTPATWHMHKLHRPTLLGASTLAKQIARHPDDKDLWLEDLRRQGYSEKRIEALLNEQAKFHSVSDVFRLSRVGEWSPGEALKHLQDQGYDADVARTELTLEKLKAIEAFDRQMASAAVDAFAAGRIDESQLGGFCSGVSLSPQEKAQHVELAHAKRICDEKPLTSSEAAAAVRAGVLSFIDYRDALRRENRSDDAITVLELMLRADIDKATAIEQHRAAQAADRAAAKAAVDAAAQAKQAAHEAALAAAQRGKTSDLEQAAIRGLVPLTRVQELYVQDFDAETVGVLMDLLESKRQDYLTAQAKRDAVVKAADGRGVNVGQLDAAVLAGVLTLQEFRMRLAQLLFNDPDAELLTATLAAKIAARDSATAAHDAAIAAGKVKHVDVATLEVLVRRGHRTMSDFDATLVALGFDDAARAALRERLQIQIDDDAAAAAIRAGAEPTLRAKGLSLEQFRRAVLLGTKTIDAFQAFLVQQRFTADAIQTLVAELQADVAEAAAAQARRTAAGGSATAPLLPIATLARAARLGLLTVDDYAARLRDRGYSDGDVALDVDVLVQEIAAVQAARAKRDAADAAAADTGLSLSQLERAVKAGAASIADYRARATALRFAPDDIDALVGVLQDELDAAAAAAARQTQLAAASAPRELARADLEHAVLAGLLSLADYTTGLTDRGYRAEDADLLTGLVEAKLTTLADARARKAALAVSKPSLELERAAVEADVLTGSLTIGQYADWLAAHSYTADDLALLVTLLEQQLADAGGTSGTP